jgi:pullulanase/glycogen debranching enzyme
MRKSIVVVALASLAFVLGSCQRPAASSSSKGEASSSEAASINASSQTSSIPSSFSSSDTGEGDYTDQTWTGKVKIYYHRDDGAYDDKRLWVWGQGVGGDSLGETTFDNQATVASDAYGLYKILDMGAAPWAGNVTTSISFIIKKAGTWADQSADTVCPFGRFAKYAVDNMITVYANAADGNVVETYARKEDAIGDRIGSAAFTDWKTLHVSGTGDPTGRSASEVGLCSSYNLFAFTASYYQLSSEDKLAKKNEYLVKTGSPDTVAFDIAFEQDIVPNKNYVVECYFALNPSKAKAKTASYSALYDTATFKNSYTYTGADLGVSSTHASTTFKVWAPTSANVEVKLFFVGTPGDLMDPVTLAQNGGHIYEMTYGDKGVWSYTLRGDYLDNENPYFYTYIVTNGAGTNEICDPYAKATGVNGRRAAILDWDTLENPTGWDTMASQLPAITSPNQLSVYEVHVRDLTADSSWKSNNGYHNGTYNAFSESGTTLTAGGTTVKTGRDNIAEMGFNAVQLLPVFDQDNDERWLDQDGKITNLGNADSAAVSAPSYNWGYNPLNYNVVEGAYSSNPYRPTTRIKEFKNLVNSYAQDGMRVIMDVVYNHVSSANNSAFQKLVPYYYFRTSSSGAFTNGSGVGNEIASERPMASSFIVDSLCWWAKEYQIKGFRFDVMGVLDCATLKAASLALYHIDPSIVLYGEGWTADGSYDMADASGKRAVAASCYTTLYPGQSDCPIGIGCFNSPGKQALKGEEHLGYGFMQKGSDWSSSDKDAVTYMLNGHLKSGSLDYSNPTQTVNYASCHDNYTNYDQMNYTLNNGTNGAPSTDSTEAMEARLGNARASFSPRASLSPKAAKRSSARSSSKRTIPLSRRLIAAITSLSPTGRSSCGTPICTATRSIRSNGTARSPIIDTSSSSSRHPSPGRASFPIS